MAAWIPKEAVKKSRILPTDVLEVIVSHGEITLRKKGKRKYSDIAKPLIDTTDWNFDREKANL